MNDKIQEARLLFKRKGIMRREFIRNEIAISWARSQVYNVNCENVNTCKFKGVKKLEISDEYLNKIENLDAVVLVNEKGEILKYYLKSEKMIYKQLSFSETEIGTNGIALSLSSEKMIFVSGYEHYHQIFFDKISIGIPFEQDGKKYAVGLILSKTDENNLDQKEIFQEFSEMIFYKNSIDSKEEKCKKISEIDEFFIGHSEELLAFKAKVNGLKNMDNNIFLNGKKGSGKEIVARIIHDASSRKNQNFYTLYCDKLPTDVLINEVLKNFEEILVSGDTSRYGTVYCEGFEALSLKSQEVLIRLLESKPVNSNGLESSVENGFRYIFSSELELDKLEGESLVYRKLLNRIKVFTVRIPLLSEIREDLPLLITDRILKYSKQLLLDPIVFSDELMTELIRYDWPGNYREFDKVVEQIIHKGRHEKIIDLSYAPKQLRKNTLDDDMIEPLENVERKEILKALIIMDYNIALTAKALGIGRSTLYRKLEKYNIEY